MMVQSWTGGHPLYVRFTIKEERTQLEASLSRIDLLLASFPEPDS